MLSFLLLVLGPGAFAYDHESHEGLFNNKGTIPLYCYKDIYPHDDEWLICSYRVNPGQSCRADAIAASPQGAVYKIPNRAEFDCTGNGGGVTCGAVSRTSQLLFALATLHHRGKGYGAMSWKTFYALMAGSSTPPMAECDASWSVLPTGCMQ